METFKNYIIADGWHCTERAASYKDVQTLFGNRCQIYVNGTQTEGKYILGAYSDSGSHAEWKTGDAFWAYTINEEGHIAGLDTSARISISVIDNEDVDLAIILLCEDGFYSLDGSKVNDSQLEGLAYYYSR
jgi:hypothetical protein